jgi:hypothetical protein
MRSKLAMLCMLVLAMTGLAAAQARQATVSYADVYCSGAYSTSGMSRDLYIISGHESETKTTFSQGDLVFLNRGSSGGVKVGDEFAVSRPEKDPGRVNWFAWQWKLKEAMGTLWKDVGKLKVVHVEADTSVARVTFTCDLMQRGDYVRPFAQRGMPSIEPGAINMFAPTSGKSTGMVVVARNWQQVLGTFDIFYLNLGASQGVKEGDTVRVFRHPGTRHDMAYKPYGTQYMLYGWGSSPVRYTWRDLPREILGEGVVLRTSENSSTVLLTKTLREIFLGDYVEIK